MAARWVAIDRANSEAQKRLRGTGESVSRGNGTEEKYFKERFSVFWSGEV